MDHDQHARQTAASLWPAYGVIGQKSEWVDQCAQKLAAAFAKVRSDTLSDAENAAFDALTRHGFTGARYCVIAAIRGLIDDPTASGTTASINTTGATYIIDVDGARRLKTEPAAPDPIYATSGDGERKVVGTNRPGGIVTTANAGDIILELQDRISELESPAAPDSTKALRQALKDLLSCYEVGHLSDESLEARDKSEPDHGYAECLRARIALRLAEDGE